MGFSEKRRSEQLLATKTTSQEEWSKWEKEVSWILFIGLLEPNLVTNIMKFWSQDSDVIRDFYESIRINNIGPGQVHPGVPSSFGLPFKAPRWREWQNLMRNINYTMHGFIQGDDGQEGWTELTKIKDKVKVINHIQKEWFKGGLVIVPRSHYHDDSPLHSFYTSFRDIMDKYDPVYKGVLLDTADISDDDYIDIKFLVYDNIWDGMGGDPVYIGGFTE